MFDFLRETKDGKIYCNCSRIEIYIESSNFKDLESFYVDKGFSFETFGFFKFAIFRTDDAKPEYYMLEVPAPLEIFYDDKRVDKFNVNTDDSEEATLVSYNIYTIYNNSLLIENLNIVQNAKNTVEYSKLVMSGKLPKTSYDNLPSLFLEVADMNSTKMDANDLLIEVLFAELCRTKNNIEIPYRFALNHNPKETDFRMINMKQLPSLTSTFAGITFEDINKHMIYGIRNSKMNKHEITSTIEDILSY
jgi:hypothetical protein